MTSLVTVSVLKIDAVQCPCSVGVARSWFVGTLNVGSKCVFAVLRVVEILLMQNHLRTVDLGNSVFQRKEVQFLGAFHD